MPELNRVPDELLARLANAQHRRDILAALPAVGLTVTPTAESRLFQVSDAESRRASLRFDEDGSIKVVTADGRATRRWFDPDGRMTRVIDPAGVEVRFVYVGGETRIERSDGARFAIRQDPFGLPEAVAFPDGATSTIDWDAPGGEVITDRVGQRAQRLRNAAGEQIGAIDPRGQRHAYRTGEPGAEGFVEHIAPSGRVDRYELDGAGRLKAWSVNGAPVARASGESLPGLPAQIEYSDGRWAEYTCAEGRVVAARGNGGEVRLEHDATGRLAADGQNGAVVRYRRDRTGLLTGIALPDGVRLGFDYDASGLLQDVIDWDGQVTRIGWAKSGQLAALAHPNGVVSAVESDPLARIAVLSVQAPGGALLHHGRYVYDVLDRLVAANEDGSERRYTYDGVDRLTAARATDPALDESWTLDPMGNRVTDNGRAFTADPDNRISGRGDDAIAWDALGRAAELRLPNGRRGRLTHDGRGQLVRIDFADGGIAEYGYDPFGRRTWKRVDGRTTRYLWAGPTLASEMREPGPGWTRRDHLFLPDLYYPLAMRIDGRTVRLHCDRRGAVAAATGPDGAVLWRARLKAFGEAVVDVAQIEQPWRLANQYCDEESGLHYNLARHYHPGLGRYLSEDPLRDPATRGNWYQYAAGDPLGRTDPTGEFIIPAVLIAVAVGAVVGAAISAGIKAYETWGQRNEPGWGSNLAKAALIGGVGGAVGAGVGALAVGALGLAGAVGVGAVLGGAIDGGVSSVAQGCAEAAMYGQAISGQQLLKDAAIGAAIGAVTAGIGALIARGMANKAANVAAGKLDEIKARRVGNTALRNGATFEDDLLKAKVTKADIKLMDAQKKPLGFSSKEQYRKFQEELSDALRKDGIPKSEVGMKGTATTFYSENPGKKFGHHWDADPLNPGDYDLNIGGGDFIERMKKSGALPSEKYGIFKTKDVVKEFPNLDEFSSKWSKSLGRDVNFVGYPNAQVPSRDTTEFVLRGLK